MHPEHSVSVLAYGMSPGDDKEHSVHDVPVDTVTYMAHGAQLRREMGAEGMLYLDDQHDRWGKREGRDLEVEWRNRLLRLLAERTDPGICVVTHSDIVSAGCEQDLPGDAVKKIHGLYKAKQEGRYNVYQTKVVASWRAYMEQQLTAAGMRLGDLIKMGWVGQAKVDMNGDADWIYSGGEHEHDRALQALPGDVAITPTYVPPGFDLMRSKRFDAVAGANRPCPAGVVVPYLYQRAGQNRLLLHPGLQADGDTEELKKIAPGVVKASLLGARVFCRAILGQPLNGELHELRASAWEMRNQEVTDTGELDETRDHLRDALKEARLLLS